MFVAELARAEASVYFLVLVVLSLSVFFSIGAPSSVLSLSVDSIVSLFFATFSVAELALVVTKDVDDDDDERCAVRGCGGCGSGDEDGDESEE